MRSSLTGGICVLGAVLPLPQSRVLLGLVWTIFFSQPTFSSVVPAKIEKFQGSPQHLLTQSVTQWWAEFLRTFLYVAVVELKLTQAGQQPAAQWAVPKTSESHSGFGKLRQVLRPCTARSIRGLGPFPSSSREVFIGLHPLLFIAANVYFYITKFSVIVH